jgi:uridine kinase
MLVIGIAGGTGSGKSTVVRRIAEQFSGSEIVVLPQDSYYVDHSELSLEQRQEINYDHPNSIEFDLLTHHLSELLAGKTIEQPIYSYIDCIRSLETLPTSPADVIIVEGILIFTNEKLRDMIDLKVFVDAEPDERLMRVIKRDIFKRGRTLDQVIERYSTTVKPMHLQFIEPSKQYADLIIPHGAKNNMALDVLMKYIKKQLNPIEE